MNGATSARLGCGVLGLADVRGGCTLNLWDHEGYGRTTGPGGFLAPGCGCSRGGWAARTTHRIRQQQRTQLRGGCQLRYRLRRQAPAGSGALHCGQLCIRGEEGQD